VATEVSVDGSGTTLTPVDVVKSVIRRESAPVEGILKWNVMLVNGVVSANPTKVKEEDRGGVTLKVSPLLNATEVRNSAPSPPPNVIPASFVPVARPVNIRAGVAGLL
jgi:hypothetical protein